MIPVRVRRGCLPVLQTRTNFKFNFKLEFKIDPTLSVAHRRGPRPRAAVADGTPIRPSLDPLSTSARALASALSDADAAFELELQANPFALNVWRAFLDTQRAPRARLSLYERALAHLPGSYKLWRAYLGEAVKRVRVAGAHRAACARAPQRVSARRP